MSTTAPALTDTRVMNTLHTFFRREHRLAGGLVRAVAEGDTRRSQVVGRHLDFLSRALHHHHTIEDEAIWPLVIERAEERGDAEDVETLEAMEAEHDTIDPALAACAEGFAAMVEHPCADHRNALDVRVTDLRAGLLDHLRHEETGALPLIQQLLSAEEFAGTERAAGKGYPPRAMPFLIPWLLDGLPDDAAARFVASKPAVLRTLPPLLRPRYQRGEAKAFGYA